MSHHPRDWIPRLAAGIVAMTATRVQVFPDVIDLSMIPTGAGLGSLLFCGFGAVRGYGPDRLGRISLLGTLLGGGGALVGLALALIF